MGRETAALEPALLSAAPGDLWVFGYGSLIWNPGFAYREAELARLEGWERRFCLECRSHRGTPERPGLVVGLTDGGACQGVAFRIDPEAKAAALRALWRREIDLADGYQPARLWVTLNDGRAVPALTFIADRAHPAYAGQLDPTVAARRIAAARGASGSNRDYLERTLAALERLGIRDLGLARLAQAVAAQTI